MTALWGIGCWKLMFLNVMLQTSYNSFIDLQDKLHHNICRFMLSLGVLSQLKSHALCDLERGVWWLLGHMT